MNISELERKLVEWTSEDAVRSIKESGHSEAVYRALLGIYNIGGEELLKNSVEIVYTAQRAGLSNDLNTKVRGVFQKGWSKENIISSIELIHYTYVENNYGRVMSEAIFDAFDEYKDKKFDASKMSIVKSRLDEIYLEHNTNPNEIRNMTYALLRSNFK